jgi:hypothetical protein
MLKLGLRHGEGISMIGKTSRLTAMLASAAAFSMAASPAFAQGWGGGHWGRHRSHVDAGDVLTGILIIGGIAAIASAASSHKRDRRDDERPEYPRERSAGYGNDNDQQWNQQGQQNGGVDNAVNRCTSEVSHGSNRAASVDSINRDGDGWRVQGHTGQGAEFTCSVDADGQIRGVQVEDRAD